MTTTSGTIKSVTRTGSPPDTTTIEVEHVPPPGTTEYRDPPLPGGTEVHDDYMDLMAANVGKTVVVTESEGSVVGVKVS